MSKSTFKQALTEAIKEQENVAYGKNGMPAFKSSLDVLVDLYAAMGALRNNPKEFIRLFRLALNEDKINTFKLLFLLRNIRGGLGERNLFREALVLLEEEGYEKDLLKIMPFITVYGRWDDLFQFKSRVLIDKAIELTISGLENPETQKLVAKWLPINNAKGNEKLFVSRLRSKLQKTPKEYRKFVSGLREVVEQKMTANQWREINYSKLPSLALTRYRNAFNKHDEDGFSEYVNLLSQGKTKVNVGAIYPYNVLNRNAVASGKTQAEINFIEEQWEKLPDYLNGNKTNILPMVDVSGSMLERVSGSTTAMDISVSLGMYLSQRNESAFKNVLCSFAERPKLFNLEMFNTSKPTEIFKKIQNHDVGYSTNLEGALKAIVEFGVENKLKQEDMPEVLLLISDMNFNTAMSNGEEKSLKALDLFKRIYREKGYEMPKIVFWNVCHNGSFTVKAKKEGVTMVSGFSPSIVTSVLSQIKTLNPTTVMLEALKPYKFLEELISE